MTTYVQATQALAEQAGLCHYNSAPRMGTARWELLVWAGLDWYAERNAVVEALRAHLMDCWLKYEPNGRSTDREVIDFYQEPAFLSLWEPLVDICREMDNEEDIP